MRVVTAVFCFMVHSTTKIGNNSCCQLQASRFRCDADGLLTKSLAGVVIAERIDCSQIEAMAGSYLFDDFLPALKVQVRHELSLSKAEVC